MIKTRSRLILQKALIFRARILFLPLAAVLLLAALPPGAAPAAESFTKTPAPGFENLENKWKTDSTEVEAKFKNPGPEMLAAVRSQLDYIYLKEKELSLLADLLLKSGNPQTAELAGNILLDDKFGYSTKMAVLGVFARFIDSAEPAEASRAAGLVEKFIGSRACAASQKLYIAALRAIAGARGADGASSLKARFEAETSYTVKAALLDKIAALPGGFEILRGEFEKARAGNAALYAREVLKAIAGIKGDDAYQYLAALVDNQRGNDTPGPFFEQARSLAASRADARFLPEIINMLSSESAYSTTLAFEYLRHYPFGAFAAAAETYSKTSDARRKGLLRRGLVAWLASASHDLSAIRPDEAAAAYAVISEAIAVEPPAMKKNATAAALRLLKNEEFRKLAAAGAAAPNGLTMAIAFYIHGERNFLIDRLKTGGFEREAIACRGVADDYYSRFPFVASDFKDEAALTAFFRFVSLQNDFFRDRVIENIIKAGDKGAIKKLVDFSRGCAPGFIEQVKRALNSNAGNAAIAGDESLLEFSGYRSGRRFIDMMNFEKRAAAAGGNLKKYLLALRNAGSGELEYATGAIAAMLKKEPAGFVDTLKDDYYPLEAKLLLLRAAGERREDAGTAIDRSCLRDIAVSGASDARLAAAACSLLAKLDPAEALEAVKKAAANENENPRRALVILKACERIKTPQCAQFIVEELVSPAVDPLLAAETASGVAEGGTIEDLKEKFRAAVEILYELGPASKDAIARLIKDKPRAAHLVMDLMRDGAGDAAVKYYLDSFDPLKTPQSALNFLRRNVNAANIGLVKEFYESRANDAGARLLAAALFHQNGIPGPAASEMTERADPDAAWAEKLIEAGFSHDFITDFYQAGEKFIETFEARRDDKKYALDDAIRGYRGRFAAALTFKTSLQEELFFSAGRPLDEKACLAALADKKTRERYFASLNSYGGPLFSFEAPLLAALAAEGTLDTAEIRTLARVSAAARLPVPLAVAREKLLQCLEASLAAKNDGAARYENAENLEALIDCSAVSEFGQLAALAGRAAKARAIEPGAYAEAVFRLCSGFDAEAAWRPLTLAEKRALADGARSSGYFDPASLADKNDFLCSLDTETLAALETADAAFIDSLIELAKKEGDGRDADLFLVKLLKTQSDDEKLKYITNRIDGAESGDSYGALNPLERYFSLYAGESLKKSFAAYYSASLPRLRYNEELTRMLIERLDAEKLRALIEAGEVRDDFEVPQSVFDAYAASDAADRYERLEAFCQSEKYRTRNNALRALRDGGDKSFAVLRALFEKHSAAGSKKRYEAGDYLGAMAETGSSLAAEFLRSVAEDEKLADYHERAISEMGEIKTVASLDWLASRLFSGRQGERAFNALKGMCYEMTVEFIEAERKAGGRLRAALASVLFQNSIHKPFLEIMAEGLEPVFEIGESFRPPASFLQSDARDGALPAALVERAVAAASAALKKAVGETTPVDGERAAFNSYLCLFLAYSRNPGDADLLIKLLAQEATAYGAGIALSAISAKGASDAIVAAARAQNPPELQKRLINILTQRNIAAAKDVYLKALSSDDRSLTGAALEAVSKFRIKEAVPAMTAALAGAGNQDYYLAGVLASFADDSFTPLAAALATARDPKGVYSALARIVEGGSYGGGGDAGRIALEKALRERYALYRGVRPRAALLAAFLLARLDGGETLKALLAEDENALLAVGADLFHYMGSEGFAKLGPAATPALMKVFSAADAGLERLAGGVLDVIEKTRDAGAAPFLAAYLKRPGGDGYVKRRALDIMGKISRDGAAVWIAVLSTEKDYYMKRRAAECLAEMAATDEFCRTEALKLLHGALEDDIKAILVKALAGAKYEKASGALLEMLKNSSGTILLDAAAEALARLDIIASIRSNLKNILNEAPNEINQAYAARVLAYCQDSASVETVGAALEKSIEKSGAFKKIELIKAAAAIRSPKFLKPLARAGADENEAVRDAAAAAIQAIIGPGYERYCAPGPVRALRADTRDGTVALSWEAPENKQPKYYEIYRDGKLLASRHENARYEDAGLKNGKSYAYRVKAIDAEGNAGPLCGAVCAVPSAPPGPVEGLKLKSGLTRIVVEWKYESPGTGAVELSHFVVERDSRPVASLPPTATSYADYGLSAGKIYSYKVYAVNAMGGAGEKATASGSPHFDMKGGE